MTSLVSRFTMFADRITGGSSESLSSVETAISTVEAVGKETKKNDPSFVHLVTWNDIWRSLSIAVKEQLRRIKRDSAINAIRLSKRTSIDSHHQSPAWEEISQASSSDTVQCYLTLQQDERTYNVTSLLNESNDLELLWTVCTSLVKLESADALMHLTFRPESRPQGMGYKLNVVKIFEGKSLDEEILEELVLAGVREENSVKLVGSNIDTSNDLQKVWLDASKMIAAMFHRSTSRIRLLRYLFPEKRYVSIMTDNDEFRTVIVPHQFEDEWDELWANCLRVATPASGYFLRCVELEETSYDSKNVKLWCTEFYENTPFTKVPQRNYRVETTCVIPAILIKDKAREFRDMEDFLDPEKSVSFDASTTDLEDHEHRFTDDNCDVSYSPERTIAQDSFEETLERVQRIKKLQSYLAGQLTEIYNRFPEVKSMRKSLRARQLHDRDDLHSSTGNVFPRRNVSRKCRKYSPYVF